MSTEFYIKPPKLWMCPVCGWLIGNCQYEQIRFDPDCGGCGTRTWRQFEPIILAEEPKGKE